MAALVKFGNAETRLWGALAAAIARFLTGADRDAGCGRSGATFYHESDPLLEDATRILRDLRVAEPVPRADAPGERWYCLHALTVDAEAMPGFLAAGLCFGGPPRALSDEVDAGSASESTANQKLEDVIRPNVVGHGSSARLLVPFLRIACERDGLSSGRAPFQPPAPYTAALRALAAAGYAEWAGSGFAWTGRIACAMEEAGLWDGQHRSRAALRESERDAQAEAAWRTMPETIRRAHFAARPSSVVAVAETLALSWRDGAWRPARHEEATPPGHVALARRLIALAHGRA